MFRPIAAILRLLKFRSKSDIYMPILRGDAVDTPNAPSLRQAHTHTHTHHTNHTHSTHTPHTLTMDT